MEHRRLTNQDAEVAYLMNLAGGYQVSQVLFAALDLNIFTVLDEGAKKIEDLSREIHCPPLSLTRLTNALCALQLLKNNRGKIKNAAIASRYLARGGRQYLGNAIHHRSNLWHFWKELGTQIKSGKSKPPGKKYLTQYQHRLRDYLAAMNDFALLKAQRIAHHLSLRSHHKLLDVGGGLGTYSVVFASLNQELRCTLIDLEPPLAYARMYINESGLAHRITTKPCQILRDTIPGEGYDLLFISNLIHIYNTREVKIILKKLWKVAARSATIAIFDYILDEPGYGPLEASLFDLTMLIGTPRGRCYTFSEVKNMLTQLGAKKIRKVPIGADSSLVIGEK